MTRPHCPHCGLRTPGARWKNIFRSKAFFGPDRIVINIISVNAFMYILSILMNPASIGISANPLSFLSPGSTKSAAARGDWKNPHRPIPSMVDGPERQLSARKHSAHTFQYDGSVANRPADYPGVWKLQDVFDLHAQWGRRLSALLLRRGLLYPGSFRGHLRSYRRGALLRKEQRRVLRANGLSPGWRLGHCNFCIWFPGSGN